DNLGGKTTYSSHNSTLTITPDKGYQIKDVLVNKVSKGKVSTLKGLTSADTVEVIFEKIPEKTPAQIKAEKIAKIKAGVKNTSIKTLKAKVTKGKIKLTWNKSRNYKINYYNIYRTTGKQKYKKIAKKSAMAYINSKSLKKGKIYKFKIVGARVIDGKTIYTKSKTIKVRAK
ncbi:MAG: hypothetical protein RSB75_01730, partial [Anaerovoracaceae bacterium]